MTRRHKSCSPPPRTRARMRLGGRRAWIIGGVAAAVILLALAAYFLLRGGSVAVPDVAGQTQAQATARITEAGLVVGTIAKVPSATVAEGSVTTQSPTAGTTVAKGTAVDLGISSGPQAAAIPDVVGMTKDAAVAELTKAGFAPYAIEEIDKAPKGQVFDQMPEAGSKVAAGTQVVVAVSLGQSAQTGTVPDVTGMPQADAEDA